MTFLGDLDPQFVLDGEHTQKASPRLDTSLASKIIHIILASILHRYIYSTAETIEPPYK